MTYSFLFCVNAFFANGTVETLRQETEADAWADYRFICGCSGIVLASLHGPTDETIAEYDATVAPL